MIGIMETAPKPWEMPTFREVGGFARWGHVAMSGNISGCYSWGGEEATGT